MGFRLSPHGESVIVVMDANRSKGNFDALSWALNHVVRPKDTVVVLGILYEIGKKSSNCFPFYMGTGVSAIWERLEFSGDLNPEVLEEEITKKRAQYQCMLQPFYRKCMKNEVKLEVKLIAGFDPKRITIEEAQNCNTRWIVLDSYMKKDKAFIHEHGGCNVAAMKDKDVASIKLFEGCKEVHKEAMSVQPPSPCWYPLSWRTNFPMKFTHREVEDITNRFASQNIVFEENLQIFEGIILDNPVLVKCFSTNDKCFWSELMILSRVRHRNISNLVGYCYTDTSTFLLLDKPSGGSLDSHLQCDELAKNLSWNARWDIALAIGSCLRYLHEDCLDGPILHGSVSSCHIVFSHGCSPMLTEFSSAKSLKDRRSFNGDLPMDGSFDGRCQPMEANEQLYPDVHAYGLFLLELLTGQRAFGSSLVDWALPLLENGSLRQVMDTRLLGSGDAKEVCYMVSAALLCLKKEYEHRASISGVLAVVRSGASRG